MKYLSICSGIEAASVAWHPLGWTPVGFAEIEPFPAAVLAHHYPGVTNFGDMTTYADWNLGGFDLLVGGTPCQAFSVAGLRNGLADHRGNLTLTFCELADHFNPEWVVWENVPGVLSSKDNAFGCLLAGLAGEVEALQPPGGKWKNAGFVSGPKRSVAWRILDAQYFGVAQRRRRVFVVASAGTHCASEVLFERESLRRDSAPSREAREDAADGTAASSFISGTGRSVNQPFEVANCLTQRMHKGINTTVDEGQTPIVCHGTQDPCVSDIAFAQGRNNGGENVVLIPIPFAKTSDCLTSAYATKWNGNASANNGSLFVLQPLAFAQNQLGEVRVGDVFSTINTNSNASGRNTPMVAQPMAFAQNTRDEVRYINGDGQIAGALAAEPGMKQTTYVHQTILGGLDYEMNAHGPDDATGTLLKVSPTGGGKPLPAIALNTMAVRRLTPVECARLQGFPDDYLDITFRGKPAADGNKYKALGNSMAVPVMRWIGQRIQTV
jgi:DNA (cytosine-5)-methyltransferase 1